MSIEEVQTAIESSRREEESESPEGINTGPKTVLEFLDQIDEENAKLSGIIECICGFQGEAGENFGNLGLAMHHFTNAIEQLTDGLCKYLKGIGIDEIERAKRESEV